jgi:formate hydrogenlyase subunit 3/multisubunit Na+/H+ antiporter MnhD subunit
MFIQRSVSFVFFLFFLISLSSVFLKTRINFIFHSRYSNPFCQREFQRLAQRPLTTLLSIPVLYLSVQCSTLNKNVSRLVLRVTSICLQLDRLNGSRWHIPNGVAMVIGFYIIRLKRKNGNRKLFKRVALSSNLINV